MSIRFRLTLLYSALLAIVLTFFSVVLFAAVAFRLNNDLDRELDTRREQVESAIQDAVRREPLLFLRTILGLEPRGDELTVAPWLPTGIEQVGLRGVPGRWGRADAVAAPQVASVASR